MDTALPQKFPFILDRNLAKPNCTGNRVCTSCDTVVLANSLNIKNKDIRLLELWGNILAISHVWNWNLKTVSYSESIKR